MTTTVGTVAELWRYPVKSMRGERTARAEVQIGALVAEVVVRMQRCAMIVHAQADLPRDRSVLRTLVRETGHTLGIGASVVVAGPVAVGDPIVLR